MLQFIDRIETLITQYDACGVDTNSGKNCIVSLTSYPPRMETLHICLFSLLSQTMKPERVLLWLAEEQFPGRESSVPEKVLKLRENGLEIRWTKDYRSYKKLVPALKEFGDAVIITADDDNFYPPGWLEVLYGDYEQSGFAKMVYGHRVHHVTLAPDGFPCPYHSWIFFEHNTFPASFLNCATGLGGILYPPGCLHQDIVRDDIFMHLAPNADDIYFWAMAVLQGNKIKAVTERITADLPISSGTPSLWATNAQGDNDEQIRRVLRHYPAVAQTLIKQHSEECARDVRLIALAQQNFDSAAYWEDRYRSGGNSGFGSYHHLSEFKSHVINAFIENHAIGSVIDFGVGDGNQLAHLRLGRYTGVDVSRSMLGKLQTKYAHDPDKRFMHVSEYAGHTADLALSLDVIYHLVEDAVFDDYMARLFDAATRYVIIYSSNIENYYPETMHVRHRKFSKWIAKNRQGWKCAQFIKNKYPLRHPEDEQIGRSFSDFYIYSKS